MRKIIFVAFIIMLSASAHAQDKTVKSLPLEDLSAFRTQAGNWQIVGDVVIDRAVEIHHEEAQAPVSNKKKKSKDNAIAAPQAVIFTAGKGILLNINDNTRKDNLVSAFEHGDIELELEVMLPKGSNSGIYLQGRYEVQLLDSWGVKNPAYSDIGGIYRNWERDAGKIYMGKAPLSNPAKAPGLWQTMKISFKAPRFEANGNKISNARFVYVDLNGVRIHNDVEVPLPTGGPIENNEKAKGPLMIQGDHGPVAFRNIRYKLLKDVAVAASDISYKYFQGTFGEVDDFATLTPTKAGTSPELTAEVIDDENLYGIVYNGKVTVPEDETYIFEVRYTGGITMSVNNQVLADEQRPDASGDKRGTITLKAGTYPFEIVNFKTASWMPPRLGLRVSTADSYPVTLTAYNSYPPDDDPTSPILIAVGNEPKLLRAFLDFKGDRSKRLTHTIGVGDPKRINYVYDLKAGNLVCAWRGDFVDATPMWHDRGDGSFRPLGAVQYFSMTPPVAFLANATESFPTVSTEANFKSKGYTLEDETARPVFNYVYQGLEITDKVYPDDEARSLSREVSIKNRGTKTGLYFKIAEGKVISLLPDGSYSIDDKQYYIKPTTALTIREVNGVKELIATVDGSSFKYSIIW